MIACTLISCDVYNQSGTGIYTLTGMVLDVDGNGVEGALVYLEGENQKVTTDSSGAFKLDKVPHHTVTLVAEKKGKVLVPVFDADRISSNGNSINVEYSTDSWVVEGCDFLQVDRVTIPMIQGTGDISPLNGVYVEDVIGVVTQVCFEQAHNNSNFTTPDPGHGKTNPQVLSADGFYMQLLPNCTVDGLKADGNSKTSDGIFVSTRDESGSPGRSKWLDSCKFNNKVPQPGDIVRVSGIVREQAPADRFGESRGLNTRTQINADKVVRDTNLVPTGKIKITDDNLLKLTYTGLGDTADQDSFRTLPFDDEGVDALDRASRIFESCEGMLIKVDNPIVVGATYYNTTPILADGGRKVGANPQNDDYPSQFNKKWMAPVVQEDDFNTEIIHAYYDSLDRFDALPQIGTVLTDDDGNKVLRGVVDYNDNGFYMIYPVRRNNLKTSSGNPLGSISYSNMDFSIHNEFKFALNDTAPEGSLYNLGSKAQQGWVNNGMFDAQDAYKPWKSGDVESDTAAFEEFSVPWEQSEDSMSVAVFNLENYTGEGARYRKYVDVTNILINNLKCPDLIFIVEMGDHDDSEDTIEYNNSSFSQTNMTGVVSARLNYETLINKIYKETNPHIQYDYRQIDPVEYTQAGKPGANIRVGFMFRTDRIEAYDIGLPTVHMKGLSKVMMPDGTEKTYTIPVELDDGHQSLVFKSSGIEDTSDNIRPSSRKPEPYRTLEAKKVLAETQTEILGVYDENGKLVDTTLSQSPGFLQDDRFYNSRLPLVCKFKFKPTGEDFYGIALHLYSKGRDDKLYGNIQPPVMTSEIRRAGQSLAVKEFIDEILKLDPSAKIIVGGDVNDFGFTYPIRKMTGEGTGNQVLYDISSYYMPENERFTYTFNGNLQQLDHIFVSPALYERMGSPVAPAGYVDPTDEAANAEWKQHVFVPHVNSLFSRDRHIQISDHDPIAARIDM